MSGSFPAAGGHGPEAANPMNGIVLHLNYQWDQTGNVFAIVRRHKENIDDQGQIVAFNSIRPQEFAQLGFNNEIHLLFLDRQVFQFLQNILSTSPIEISITPRGGELKWKPHQIEAIRQLFALFRGKIFRLDFHRDDMEDPNRQFWEDCDKYFEEKFPEIFYEAQELAFDVLDCEDEINFCLNWLMNRRRDGKHKNLPVAISNDELGYFIERVKQVHNNGKTTNRID